MKRGVVIADMHCGHQVGLTHPDFDARPQDARSVAYRLWKTRRRCWDWLTDRINAIGPLDFLIVNGDCIDGKGDKSGGTELLQTDRNEQVLMAIAAIEMFNASHIVMSYGTTYHTGRGEDWEDQIARGVDALKIGGHDWLNVNGLIFDYKHHISRSIIPHGRHTAIARERLWNVLWSERGEYPKAHVYLRSHVHYHTFCGGPGWLAMTTPALQAYGSKFGARIATGTVDYGLVSFEVENEQLWTWTPHILRFKRLKPRVVKI